MDHVVIPHKDVSEDGHVIVILLDAEGTSGSQKLYIVFSEYFQPHAIYHDIEGGKQANLFAVENVAPAGNPIVPELLEVT